MAIIDPRKQFVGGLAGKAITALTNQVKQQARVTAPVVQKAVQQVAPVVQQASQKVVQRVTQPRQPIGVPLNRTQPVTTQLSQRLDQAPVIGGIRQFNRQTFGTPSYMKVFDPKASQEERFQGAQDLVMGFTGGGVANPKNITKLIRNPKLEPAVKLLQDKITKEDVDLLGKFAAQVQKSPRKNFGSLGKTVQSFAEQTFGPQASTWSNTQLAKAIDYTLERIGQGKNPAGLGLSTVNVSKGLAKPGSKSLVQNTESVTPVQKVINALTQAKPLRGQQETLYSQERGARAALGKKVQNIKTGEAGFQAELGKLKGELPKVEFESIRSQFTQGDIDSLFKQVANHPKLQYFESVQAREGLAKLLGERGGGLPTKSQIALLDKVFGSEFTEAVLKNRSGWEKFKSALGDAWNLPRAVSASMDLSAPLRQGLPLVTRKEFWKSLGPMVKSLVSKNSFENLQNEIASRPSYQSMQDAGLSLTDIGGLLPQEEAFLTSWAGKLPGINASNRAYVGFLNKLRADTFDSLSQSLQKEGRLNPDALKSVASFVNTATGRGDLPTTLSQASNLLNGLFFSPRLMASRIQLLNPQFYIKQDPLVRKEALKSVLGATGAVMTVLGLAKLAGAEVGTDPRNADFAKIKTGNTRYDITGGFGAYIRIASQLISGKLISSTTGKETELGEGYRPLTRLDILFRFLQNKESPVASLLSSMLQGKDPVGEPINFREKDPFKNPIAKLFIPMLAQDMREAYEEWGPSGIARALPATIGVGSQTYGYNLPDKLEAQTEGMTREEKRAFTEQARQIAVARAEGQEVNDNKKQILDHFEQKLLALPEPSQQEYIRQLSKKNPKLAKDLLSRYKEARTAKQKGLTPIDDEIKGLPIPARVKYIDSQLRSMPYEQRVQYFQELKRKGIITKEVWEELKGQ